MCFIYHILEQWYFNRNILYIWNWICPLRFGALKVVCVPIN